MPKNVTIVSRIKKVVRALGPPGPGSTPLTQVQVEDPDSEVFGSVSGQGLSQAIIAWGARITSVFKGQLLAYFEGKISPEFVLGALFLNYGAATTANIIKLPSLIENSTITFTGTLTENKPVNLITIPDTGGPWTLSVVANGKTKALTRNGGGTAEEETFVIRANGTDLLHPSGGIVWETGT